MKVRNALTAAAGIVLAAVLLASCSAGPAKPKGPADFKGQTLTIWSFTDELKAVADKFKEAYPGVEVTYTIVPNEQYLAKIKPVLKSGVEAPDVFTGEAAYVKDFVEDAQWDDLSQAPYNADVAALTPYVADIGKDAKGAIRGISWQATAGGYFYKRSMAKKYFGTDDPAKVSELLATWDKVIETGRTIKTKSKGKDFLVSSIGDLFNPFYAARTAPWVSGDTFTFDPALKQAIDVAKTIRTEGLDAKAGQWSPPWFGGMKKDGNVFLYILPTWGLHYVLKTNGTDAVGDWGLAAGPSSYFWGGTWLGIYPKSTKKELAWEFVKWFTLNKETLTWWAKKTGDFLAHTEVVNELKDTFSEPFLAGQNHYAYFAAETAKINGKLISRYDQQGNGFFQNAVNSYLEGKVKTADAVIEQVKSDFRNAYPDLKVQ